MLRDQSARDHAAHTHNETMLVEAGAGTGKTRLLITRILALIEAGVAADRIAAVTFTVKAAGDLKQRLRAMLQTTAQTERVRAALNALDRMTVCTIHALASEMLRTLPVEANLPPDFIALDELQQRARLSQFRDNWLAAALDRDVPRAFEIADACGWNLLDSGGSGVAALYNELVQARIRPAEIVFVAADGDALNSIAADMIAAAQRFLAHAGNCRVQDDGMMLVIEGVRSWLQEQPAEIYSVTGARWLRALRLGNSRTGKQENWCDKQAIAAVRDAQAQLADISAQVRSTLVNNIVHELVTWIGPGIDEYRAALRVQGALGFDDLLLYCRDMLRDSRIARDFFKKQYDHIHIDEFQDTDPLQVEIAFYLCEQDGDFAADWRNVSLKPGKLFIVGDPKQSIYRFRGADMLVYRDVAQRIAEAGRVLAISTNFRSRPSIVREVNALFTPVMNSQDEHIPSYEPLVAHDGAQHAADAIELLLPPSGYTRHDKSAVTSGRWEAAAIAEHLVQRRVEGHRYGDAAILLRKGTRLNELLEALSARDIPFVSFMNSTFAERVEVESLLTMLTALANPQHTVAVVGVLRSPWFALSDDELYQHKITGGSFVYTIAQGGDSPVVRALAELRVWHERAKRQRASALAERLLASFTLDIVYGLKSDGMQRVQNLRTVVAIIRRLEQGGVTALSRIVESLNEMDKLVQSTELDASEGQEDAVQILTIHKSKGLEFATVYLYAYSDKERDQAGWLLSRRHSQGPRIAFNKSKKAELFTTNYAEANTLETAATHAENDRLLYVALTRACDKLVVPMGWRRSSRKSDLNPDRPAVLAARYWPAAHLEIVAGQHEVVSAQSASEPLRGFRPYAHTLALTEDAGPADATELQTWAAVHDAQIARLCAAPVSADDDVPVVAWEQVRARRFGTFMHAALERLAHKSAFADAWRAAEAAVVLEADAQAEARSLLEQIMASALFAHELPRARRVLTELPLFAAPQGVVQQRAVDLLFENEHGEWIVLDYKTDHLLLDQAAARAEVHRPQLQDYAALLREVIGRAPAELRVYFLRPNVLYRLP